MERKIRSHLSRDHGAFKQGVRVPNSHAPSTASPGLQSQEGPAWRMPIHAVGTVLTKPATTAACPSTLKVRATSTRPGMDRKEKKLQNANKSDR